MDVVLSLLMLTSLALIAGAIWLWRKQGVNRQVWLMILLAMVMLINVALWTVPNSSGLAPIGQELQQ
ncbi:hypothetical protein [Altericroceibacterium xinjiangense]|uniref:hypothetical protein n=1 Tax=Altericroceibacterium xinjiangense TaxID=762261 RepID=UPI000F7EC5C4|nr:hypothetical protein [Altericroceibacterium xinjiangense]